MIPKVLQPTAWDHISHAATKLPAVLASGPTVQTEPRRRPINDQARIAHPAGPKRQVLIIFRTVIRILYEKRGVASIRRAPYLCHLNRQAHGFGEFE